MVKVPVVVRSRKTNNSQNELWAFQNFFECDTTNLVPTLAELGTKIWTGRAPGKVAVYKLFHEACCIKLALVVNAQAFVGTRETDSFFKRLSGKALQFRDTPGDSFATSVPTSVRESPHLKARFKF